jgi:hypothetical protein
MTRGRARFFADAFQALPNPDMLVVFDKSIGVRASCMHACMQRGLAGLAGPVGRRAKGMGAADPGGPAGASHWQNFVDPPFELQL